MVLSDIFPIRQDETCACGCGKKLEKPKKRWASLECQTKSVTFFFIVKGDGKVIRKELFKRDGGICSICNKKSDEWQADHVLPVNNGGGACDLDNFQTLCLDCHKNKTLYTFSHHKAYSSHDALI